MMSSALYCTCKWGWIGEDLLASITEDEPLDDKGNIILMF